MVRMKLDVDFKTQPVAFMVDQFCEIVNRRLFCDLGECQGLGLVKHGEGVALNLNRCGFITFAHGYVD